MTDDDRSPRGPISLVRRVIVAVIIVSFGIAAIGGIIVLLSGEIGETAGRVLSTTAIIGAYSLAVLCCVTLAGRRLQTFGLIGSGVAVVSAALVLFLVWYDASWELSDGYWKITWTGVILTIAFSLASLLLLLADRRQPAVRIGLLVTLALIAVVLGMVLYLVWWSDTVDGDAFARVLGIAAILAALGSVVVPVLSLLLRGRGPGPGLSAAAAQRLEAEAARRGVTPDALVGTLLSESDAAPAPHAHP